MPIQLITGPANSEKAGIVLDAYRAALPRRPILVVPTRADVDHYRRELARGGTVLGARVERFAGLIAEAAARARVPGRPVGPVARRRLVGAAIAATPLGPLAGPARSPRFVDSTLDLFAELEAARVEPGRLAVALRDWAGADERRAFATDIAAVYGTYRRALDRLGRTDPELHARAAFDAMRLDPTCWGGTPVFFYGFDDFTPVELDAIETLGGRVDAPVCVSLPHEPGRLAFAGRAGTFHVLEQLADEHVALAPRDDHYDADGRRALHHLERNLFEPGPERIGGGEAVTLLEAATERAELDLVAETVAALVRDGHDPADVAVVLRSPAAVGPLVASAFASAGVPHTLERRARFADTGLGGGLVALLRLALLDADGAALVRWLRTPGVVKHPRHVDALETEIRRRGLDGPEAIASWERDRWPLDGVARLRSAASAGPRALIERAEAELDSLFARPRGRAAAVLDDLEVEDARALATARAGFSELRELAGSRLGAGPSELVGALEALEVRSGGDAADSVLICDPLGLRARRVRTLAVCRLQEGIFPRSGRPETLLSERDRADIARTTGVVLPHRPDWLDAERYLFYATVSRPRERLFLSWHLADDDGGPALRSLFVDDVCELFGDLSVRGPAPPIASATASTPALAAVPARLSDPSVLAALGGRPAFSASALEAWARCPVRWLVERQLAAKDLQPEAAALVRGRLTHHVLCATLSGVGERTGSTQIREAQLPVARALLRDTLNDLAPRYAIATDPARLRAALNELQRELDRYLADLVRTGGDYQPRHFELPFGGLDGDAPPLALCDGRLPVRGRIDRVDVSADGHRAIVCDYKGRRVVKPDDWLDERVFQLPIYMLAVAELLGLETVGGFYQPIGPARPSDRRPRGLLAADADPERDCVGGDRRDAEDVRALVDAAVQAALVALEELRAGELEARPLTCGFDGRCAHPSICRLEAL